MLQLDEDKKERAYLNKLTHCSAHCASLVVAVAVASAAVAAAVAAVCLLLFAFFC